VTAHGKLSAATELVFGRSSAATPTLVHVAKLAGVSEMTVSRAINGGPVSDRTREKVDTAIRMLDYRPNEVARALARRRLIA
jgi:DNA-binding LacI/PurR family transcriptional regulator